MGMKNIWRTYPVWALCVTVWQTVCFIAPYFYGSPTEGILGGMVLFTHIAACAIGTFWLIYLCGTLRHLCAFLLPLSALFGSVLSFYLIGYRTTLTPMLLDATLHTNIEEAIGVISWQVILWVITNITISGIFVWYRWTHIELTKAWLHALIAIVFGTLYLIPNERLRASLFQRYPYNIARTCIKYLSLKQSMHEQRLMPTYQMTAPADSLTIVLVIGEAARADHLQLNGYARPTTPRLSKQPNIVSLPHLYCEQTHTLASLPHILTRADSIHPQYQYTESSFISIFRRTGYFTAWISNQNLGSTFSPFLNESDTLIFVNAGKSEYFYTQWIDEDLLPAMQVILPAENNNSLLILHTIGSHWYYNNHVPEQMQLFQPVTRNKVITQNTNEQIINSYDNTILYMDYFVDSVITILKDRKALLIYQSDHGEALGEEGTYTHANGSEYVKNPACFIWYSDRYAEAYPDKIKALIRNMDKRYRTDYVFYSILFSAGIEAEGDSPEMNIFR